MADIHRYWEQVRHVPVGEKPDATTQQRILELIAGATPVPSR